MTDKLVSRWMYCYDLSNQLYGVKIEEVEDPTWTVEQLVSATADRVASAVSADLIKQTLLAYGKHRHNITAVCATIDSGDYYDDHSTYINLHFMGPETEEERIKREAKQAAEKIIRQQRLAKQKEKDLETVQKLAKKHGFSLVKEKDDK